MNNFIKEFFSSINIIGLILYIILFSVSSNYFTKPQAVIIASIAYFLWISLKKLFSEKEVIKNSEIDEIKTFLNSRSRRIVKLEMYIEWNQIIKAIKPSKTEEEIDEFTKLFYKDKSSLIGTPVLVWVSDSDNFFNSYSLKLTTGYHNSEGLLEYNPERDMSKFGMGYSGELFGESFDSYKEEIIYFFGEKNLAKSNYSVVILPGVIGKMKSQEELGNMSGFGLRHLSFKEELSEKFIEIPYFDIVDTYFKQRKEYKLPRNIIQELAEQAQDYSIDTEWIEDDMIAIKSELTSMYIRLESYDVELS